MQPALKRWLNFSRLLKVDKARVWKVQKNCSTWNTRGMDKLRAEDFFENRGKKQAFKMALNAF